MPVSVRSESVNVGFRVVFCVLCLYGNNTVIRLPASTWGSYPLYLLVRKEGRGKERRGGEGRTVEEGSEGSGGEGCR